MDYLSASQIKSTIKIGLKCVEGTGDVDSVQDISIYIYITQILIKHQLGRLHPPFEPAGPLHSSQPRAPENQCTPY